MNQKKILQIEDLEASEILSRFDVLTKEFKALQNQLSNRQSPAENLTRQEVAAFFKISLPTVHEWTNKGILKSYKIANKVYFKRAEIEAALTQVKPRHSSI
jgi:excisionase family DNA binding protein